jgi:hypothetical protein
VVEWPAVHEPVVEAAVVAPRRMRRTKAQILNDRIISE